MRVAWDGVVWGRLGRGDRAWLCWSTVGDPSLAAWIAAERGRVLRELGLHTAARELDLAGLAVARDVTDTVMLRISLAADRLGEGLRSDPDEAAAHASELLTTALPLLAELPPGPRTARQRLRAGWLAVEISLARGERLDAHELPWRDDHGLRYQDDYDAGSDFHRAKGLLFAGVARRDRWLLGQSASLAPPALAWAAQLALFDLGDEPAIRRAIAVWDELRPPPGHERSVATSPVAVRLARHR